MNHEIWLAGRLTQRASVSGAASFAFDTPVPSTMYVCFHPTFALGTIERGPLVEFGVIGALIYRI
jgi:hypothetical protein